MNDATKTEAPKLIECGDVETIGGWWTECSHCQEETSAEDCWDTCGKCGARWWEGDFVDFEG
jgi:hypothetical protein